ncbi:uncharacterized protein LAESUDRAFT_327139 [Laetiporus sulphureus 93-53]|uniref:Uncharacterized protein n=1 Tax=Laetiporus sulphureus 93-53 TaxID=1314785 RepID=A0A165D012_9APHY|nr:uncharacterized protein LAESUDRAFT_327139 [Laetiporus sulphureus 93-53]KZT03860.1 hypothetical protein LAESUDRAFT_327139 [Laetiporus sulphureus 93-53]
MAIRPLCAHSLELACSNCSSTTSADRLVEVYMDPSHETNVCLLMPMRHHCAEDMEFEPSVLLLLILGGNLWSLRDTDSDCRLGTSCYREKTGRTQIPIFGARGEDEQAMK